MSQIDSSHEAGWWWNPWHCDRMCAQKIGCHYLGMAVHEGVRVRMRSISVCPLQKGPGHFFASCGTILCMDGIGACDHVLRSTLLERDSSTCPQSRPCCPVFDCPAAPLPDALGWTLVADRGSSHKQTVANRGPTHAFVVFHRDSWGTRGGGQFHEHGEQLCVFVHDIYLCTPSSGPLVQAVE